MPKLSQTLSVTCMSAFAGGCLVVSVIMVPTWRKMDPDAFLDWFSENGPRLGLTLFPADAVGALSTVLAFAGASRRRSDSRLLWGLSSLASVGTLVLLPVYFGDANTRLLNRMPEVDVGTELEAWQRWQWRRTALAVVAVACGSWGLRHEQGKG